MAEKILKFHRGEVKGVDEEKKTLEAVISTIQEDRDGDIVEPKAFESSIKNYKKHPVLLANHDYYDLRSQIGEAVDIQIEDKLVRAKFKYIAGLKNEDGSPMNPQADYAWELAKRGLASYSIGFIGTEWEPISKNDNGQEFISGRRFKQIELMEVSQVLIPSNRGALQASADLCEMAIKSFKDEKAEIKIVPVPEKKEPDPAPAPDPEPENKHYTEEVLGEADKKSTAEADKIAIQDAVKSTIKQIIGGK